MSTPEPPQQTEVHLGFFGAIALFALQLFVWLIVVYLTAWAVGHGLIDAGIT